MNPVGFEDNNFVTEYGGNDASTAYADVTASPSVAFPSFTENTFRVRGGSAAGGAGAPNGWDALAPQYSQGAEVDVNTTGYKSIYLTFDWFTTAQGVRDLQEQYSTNINDITNNPWTNINPALVAPAGGDYYGASTTANPTGALIDLSSVAGANNNPNFGIRLVSAYDPGLPAITDSSTTISNNQFTLPEPHGQYASSTLVNGAPAPINSSSGNWRFGNITVNGVVALPAWLAPNSIATYNSATKSLVIGGASKIIGDPGTDAPVITFNSSGAVLTIDTGTVRPVTIGSLAVTGGNSVVMTTGTTTHVLVDKGAFSIAAGNSVNIGNNFLDIQGGTLSGVVSAIQSGTLVSSSSTGGSLGAIGAIVNGSVFTAAKPFDTVTPGTNDVLVRYTYVGDANLDGVVDGSDYTKIDNGFNTLGSGWVNGDFNYDNHIDGSDYTLIDNAFNTQGSTLAPTAQLATQLAGSGPAPFAAAIPSTVIGTTGVPALTDLLKKDKTDTLISTVLA